jgi:hypothetical protein
MRIKFLIETCLPIIADNVPTAIADSGDAFQAEARVIPIWDSSIGN